MNSKLIKILIPFQFIGCAILDTVVKILYKPQKRQSLALIVKLDVIGDFFVWLQSGAVELCQFARKNSKRVVLIANSRWASYATELKIWDEVLSIDHRCFLSNPFYRFRILRQIRLMGANLLIQPRASRSFWLEDAITRVSGASKRIGTFAMLIRINSWMRSISDRFYTSLIDIPKTIQVHEIIRNSVFLKELSNQIPKPFNSWSTVNIDKMIMRKPYVVLAIGASWIGRIWPIDKFLQLAKWIQDKFNLEVVLIGGENDKRYARLFADYFKGSMTNLVGSTSVIEMVSIIKQADLVVANESAAFHMSAALNKPVVVLLGGGHFGWFAPYPDSYSNVKQMKAVYKSMDCFGCNWKCRYSSEKSCSVRCIYQIEVEEVKKAIIQVLGIN